MKKSLYAVLAATALLAASAHAQNLAVVNGKPVPLSRVDALAAQVMRSGRPVTPDMEAELKQAVIDREILAQEARRQGLGTDPDYQAQLQFAQETLLIRALVNHFQETHPVTDADVAAAYEEFRQANGGKEYHARHILVESKDKADALLAQLKKGAKFETLAKQNSKDPGSGANGGDLGWAPANGYVPEFAQALQKLDKGQLSDAPVQTQFGWHIIQVEDVREAQLPPLEQLKPQLAQQIGQRRLAEFQENLRKQAKVK
jgi:peptidyl-prolyl cis-trans isomerase C